MRRNPTQPVAICSTLTLFIIIVATLPSPLAAADTDDVTATDYNVYDAVLNVVHFPQDAPAAIYDKTLNFKCGMDSGNPIYFNGCSGMIMPPDTPKTINQILRQSWPKMEQETWDDFERVNAKSTKLQDHFNTLLKHDVVGEDISRSDIKKQDSHGGTFFFSRVGFNSKRTEAIVFVVLASNTERVPWTGNYFLVRLDESKDWKLSGRVQYLESDADAR